MRSSESDAPPWPSHTGRRSKGPPGPGASSRGPSWVAVAVALLGCVLLLHGLRGMRSGHTPQRSDGPPAVPDAGRDPESRIEQYARLLCGCGYCVKMEVALYARLPRINYTGSGDTWARELRNGSENWRVGVNLTRVALPVSSCARAPAHAWPRAPPCARMHAWSAPMRRRRCRQRRSLRCSAHPHCNTHAHPPTHPGAQRRRPLHMIRAPPPRRSARTPRRRRRRPRTTTATSCSW